MKMQTKQRIVGGLVLLALVALFLPLLYHNIRPSTELRIVTEEEGKAPTESTVAAPLILPPEATVETTAIAPGAAVESPTNTPPPFPTAEETSLVAPAQEEPAPIAQTVSAAAASPSVSKAWVLQVGSFTKAANAERLMQWLRSQGWDVFTRQDTQPRKIIRIYVGPEMDLQKLRKLQKQMKQQFQLTSVIKKYTL
ncbi:MAG: hypothetical protein A3F41_06815 [Coxiella sp. RIFCSPHIGHO2_12_FULL_44_14]|nr:MAG: hypothetical protein A3F41_06815 [Coxiella sp. RIFCSPHIGHO2_12_FULL_44_14]